MYDYGKFCPSGYIHYQEAKFPTSLSNEPLALMVIPRHRCSLYSLTSPTYQRLQGIQARLSPSQIALHLQTFRQPCFVGYPYMVLNIPPSGIQPGLQCGIENSRSSTHHSPGNSFAENNIHSAKDMIQAALLHRKLINSNGRHYYLG